MRSQLLFCLLGLSISAAVFAQDPSLGDVARASRAHQAKSPKPVKVLSNEENNPQAIKDGEDPLEVFTRARSGFLHDTSHRCQQESSNNSGAGSHKNITMEVAAADQMRLALQEGSDHGEWLLVGDTYYARVGGAGWRKMTSPQEVGMGKITFPAGLIPQELQFGFQPSDLKPQGDQVIEGVPTVLYTFVTHTYDMNRTINYWFGKADSLAYRIDMRTESKQRDTRPVIWGESTTCKYGVEIRIEPPL